MMIGIAIFFVCLAAVFVIIAIHECGHFLAGAAAGIPLGAMRIRLFTFPQHVALRSDDHWLHPQRDYDRYVAASMSFLKGRTRAGLYVSGGLLIQTFAFVCVAFGLVALGIPYFWLIPVLVTLVSVPCLYLCFDLLSSRFMGKPCGDFSFLWKISPALSLVLTSFVIAVHGGTLIYVAKNA